MNRDKLRIRFRKGGELRFLSHHDLLRAFERMMRRAGLPLRFSQGFHPKPRMVFASALGLGIVGCQEVLEIELEEPLVCELVHARLAEQAPHGMEVLSVQRIDPRTTARAHRAVYELPVPVDCLPALGSRINELLEQEESWVERTKPEARRINVRAYLIDLTVRRDRLVIELRITPQGSARPEEVLRVLGLDELLPDGAVLERTLLELEDESGVQDTEPAGRSLLPAATASSHPPGSKEPT